jgi:hypothetical protein
MADTPDAPTLAQIVGANAKTLRGDITGDKLAGAARRRGLTNWGTGRVADLEAGRVAPTLPTLIGLALALGDIRGDAITLVDLIRHDGFVALTDELTVSGEAIGNFVAGAPVRLAARDTPGGREKLNRLRDYLDARGEKYFTREHFVTLNPKFARLSRQLCVEIYGRSGEAEERIADNLDVDVRDLAVASAHLWKRSMSEERDARGGADASAQKRGRITRELQAQLRDVLGGG